MWAKNTDTKKAKHPKNHDRPTVKNTSRGVLYADPKDILSSRAAQRQLEFIRESKLLRELKRRPK